MDRTWVLLVYEWRLMARHRLLLFVSLPVVGALVLSKYGLFLVLPVSALVLGIPRTGKMHTGLNRVSVLPVAFTMLAVQVAAYVGIAAAFHSAPGIWVILPALAVSLAIAAGRAYAPYGLHSR